MDLFVSSGSGCFCPAGGFGLRRSKYRGYLLRLPKLGEKGQQNSKSSRATRSLDTRLNRSIARQPSAQATPGLPFGQSDSIDSSHWRIAHRIAFLTDLQPIIALLLPIPAKPRSTPRNSPRTSSCCEGALFIHSRISSTDFLPLTSSSLRCCGPTEISRPRLVTSKPSAPTDRHLFFLGHDVLVPSTHWSHCSSEFSPPASQQDDAESTHV